jgi:hypothetical protein
LAIDGERRSVYSLFEVLFVVIDLATVEFGKCARKD